MYYKINEMVSELLNFIYKRDQIKTTIRWYVQNIDMEVKNFEYRNPVEYDSVADRVLFLTL
mgnify:CR=1 FL=1